MRRIVYGVLLATGLSSMALAQTVSEEFEKSLNDQGFVIESTGYTWLWRIVVRATDGVHEREIVISRGSEQILQDNWVRTEQTDSDVRKNLPKGAKRPADATRSNKKPPPSSESRPFSRNQGGRPSGDNGRPGGDGGSGGHGGSGK